MRANSNRIVAAAGCCVLVVLLALLLTRGNRSTELHNSKAPEHRHRASVKKERSRPRVPYLVGVPVDKAIERLSARGEVPDLPENPSECEPLRTKGRVFLQDPMPGKSTISHGRVHLQTNFTASCGKSASTRPCVPSEIKLSINADYVSAAYYARVQISGLPERTDQVSIGVKTVGGTPCSADFTASVAASDPRTGELMPIDANPLHIYFHWGLRPTHYLLGFIEWDSWCYGKKEVVFTISAPGLSSASDAVRTPACQGIRSRPLLSGSYVDEI